MDMHAGSRNPSCHLSMYYMHAALLTLFREGLSLFGQALLSYSMFMLLTVYPNQKDQIAAA